MEKTSSLFLGAILLVGCASSGGGSGAETVPVYTRAQDIPCRYEVLETVRASSQIVRARGEWKDGKWTVVFIRDLTTPSRQDINFKKGNRFLLAFAIWDGANKDKNSNKVVSFWKTLVLNHEQSSQ